MRRPNRASLRTFLVEAFIQNTKSFCQTSPTLTYPLSSTIRAGGHCVTSWLLAHLCLFRSFTPTCMDLIIQYLSLSLTFEVHALWSLDIVSDVLHVPRVEHPKYPSCDRFKTVSKDELISFFCKRPSDWGEHQFTSCSAFAKGPKFLNMVTTFVLHPLSHYNSITEPRA